MQGVLSIGGIDASRIGTHSVKFKIIELAKVARLAVPLTKISIQSPPGREDKPWSWTVPTGPSTPNGFLPAVLDTGASITEVPFAAHKALVELLEKIVPEQLFAQQTDGKWNGDVNCKTASMNITG